MQRDKPGVRVLSGEHGAPAEAQAVSLIFKIVPASLWRESAGTGLFLGSAVDLADGFIHFSTSSQLQETAVRHFSGQSDLLVAAVSLEALGDALRWEASRGGDLFPHLYAPLPMAAVAWVEPLPIGYDGRHDTTGLPT